MTELMESPNPAFPAQDEKHTELEIKIVEINDGNGTGIMGGGSEYDGRQFAVVGKTKTTIKYELKNQESIVAIEVHPDPGNSVASQYYGKAAAAEFVEFRTPGQYTIEWDGRATKDGERLLIQGEYKVTAWAVCQCGNEVTDETKIKVKKPYADSYGAVYPASYGSTTDLTPPATHVRTALKTLSDGSGFECGGSSTATAHQSLTRMNHFSSVWFWDGHAAPGLIVFFTGPRKTRLVSDNAVSTGMAATDLAPVSGLAEGALDHVFLVVLLGCETAKTPAGGPSLPAALTDQGVDHVVAFTEKVYLRAYLKWTQDFFKALDQGDGIANAGILASTKAAAADRPGLSPRFFYGGGASGADKLLPARYGRRKR